jgi:hypothetical protein
MHVAYDRPSGCCKCTSLAQFLIFIGARLPINIYNTTFELIAKHPYHLLRLFVIKPAR